MNHVLIVDDEAEIRDSLEAILREEGYVVTTAGTAAEALVLPRDPHLRRRPARHLAARPRRPRRPRDIRAMDAATRPEVIIISGHGTIEAAVRATKLGAYDFLEKPLSLDRTLIVLKNAIEARRLRAENHEFARQLRLEQRSPAKASRPGPCASRSSSWPPPTAASSSMASPAPAKNSSPAPCTPKACAATASSSSSTAPPSPRTTSRASSSAIATAPSPADLPEKRGTFERADGGTLFLDEVGDMSLKTQAKVLRALDEQRFLPVGATQPINVDVRVIAATNKDLEEEIARGNFREDLFYRLNVIPFFRPAPARPQRRHPAAGPRISAAVRPQYGRPRVEIADDALELLRQYHWPGNVRELKNVIERVLILNPQVQRIERHHLPMLVHRSAGALRRLRHPAAGSRRLRARLHPQEDR